ncbi:Serine-threonine/tyrosine-protein kinase catalytic domain [Trinorchestia longiramus]|nr:Serine-threonine/tyrosine-protein kinase catalytic domain [Trinorchestia longiramus]
MGIRKPRVNENLKPFKSCTPLTPSLITTRPRQVFAEHEEDITVSPVFPLQNSSFLAANRSEDVTPDDAIQEDILQRWSSSSGLHSVEGIAPHLRLSIPESLILTSSSRGGPAFSSSSVRKRPGVLSFFRKRSDFSSFSSGDQEKPRSQSYFVKKPDFSIPFFQENPNIPSSTFLEKPDFPSSSFQEKPDFPSSSFQEKPDFPNSSFQEKTDFPNSSFQEKPDFPNSSIQEKPVLRSPSLYYNPDSKSSSSEPKPMLPNSSSFAKVLALLPRDIPGRNFHWSSMNFKRRKSSWCPGTAANVFVCCLLVLASSLASAINIDRCHGALGMADKRIPDHHITASSHYDAAVDAYNARAHIEVGGGAWCPRAMIFDEGLEYLEVNLDVVQVVTKVEVQGRFGNGQGREYAEKYKLQYWRPTMGHWTTYRNGRGEELLEGNTNTYLAKASPLSPPILASRVRFVPYSNHPRTVCMRVELYGCPYTDGLVSYSMEDGEMRGSDDGLRDMTYDGVRRGDRLSGGLGQLSDGETGHTNYRVDTHGREKGYEWVGWRNESRPDAEFILINFEFDQLRNFSAIHIHTSNLITKGVQIFSRADVYVSSNNETFEKVEEFLPEVDRIFENARPVTIKLDRIMARRIKLELYFSLKWIMISEVTFDSVPCRCELLPTPTSPLYETLPPYGMAPSDQPHFQEKAAILEHAEPPTQESPKKPNYQNSGLLIGCIAALGVIFGTVPAFLVIMYYRNKNLKKGAKAQQYEDASAERKIVLEVNDGPMTVNNGSIVSEFAHSKGRFYGDLEITDETAAMYQEPYKGPLNGQGFYSIGRGTIAYEEPLDMGPDTEDSLDYAVPDVTLTSSRGRDLCSFSPVPQYPFMNAIMNIPPPPIPPPPEEPSHAPPPTDVQGVIGSAFFALPESDVHKEDPSVVELFAHQINLMEVIGESNFGYAQLCELEPSKSASRQQLNYTNGIHVMKKLKPKSCDITKDKFMKEIHILSQLHDESIARLAGVIAEDEGPVMVIQFSEYGDLYQFLRQHVTSDIDVPAPDTDMGEVKRLSRGALLHIASQIASGMKYLESKSIVHRDLATRNCLISPGLSIKISDVALCRSIYADDYCNIEGRSLLPVRWMAPESLIHSLYTVKTDVWSFGVTLWEIFTMARKKPLEELGDRAAVERICQTCHVDGQPTLLPQPSVYGREIYQMMTSCWRAVDRQRPPFWEIHMFLKRKNMGYSVDYFD